MEIWTVGHSNHELDAFVALLRDADIDVVVDVRSFPYSRFAPQFNQDQIDVGLRDAGLRYLFLGEELGGRPSRQDHYDEEGHALYGLVAAEASFQGAIARLLRGTAKHRVAVMCSEGKPDDCHRRLLVGKVLAERGVLLHHILPNGVVLDEREVEIGGDGRQASLFGERSGAWRSTQSVSQRRRLSTSSAA
jgi:uncharacterized protein (DUF488 family)